MTPAKRAREIVMRALAGATWYEVADQPDWQKRVTDLVAPAIRHALAAQAAQTDSGLHTYRGTPVSCEEYEQLIVAPLRRVAAQTRALREALEQHQCRGLPDGAVWCSDHKKYHTPDIDGALTGAPRDPKEEDHDDHAR